MKFPRLTIQLQKSNKRRKSLKVIMNQKKKSSQTQQMKSSICKQNKSKLRILFPKLKQKGQYKKKKKWIQKKSIWKRISQITTLDRSNQRKNCYQLRQRLSNLRTMLIFLLALPFLKLKPSKNRLRQKQLQLLKSRKKRKKLTMMLKLQFLKSIMKRLRSSRLFLSLNKLSKSPILKQKLKR